MGKNDYAFPDLRLILAALFVAQNMVIAAAPVFRLTDLGAINTSSSTAYSINDYGQVAGKTSGENIAFLWTPTVANGINGTMIRLPAIVETGTPSQAYGINNYGQVVGITQNFSAFLWTPNSPNSTSGSTIGIGEVSAARAYAINTSGQVVVGTGSGAHQVAGLWSPTSANGQTGSISNFDLGSSARFGINHRGQVANGQFIWTPLTDNGSTGSVLNLVESSIWAQSYAINTSGNAVGGGAGVNGQDAVLWKAKDSTGSNYLLMNLGRLIDGHAEAFGLNDRDEVVGVSKSGRSITRDAVAFLWDQDHGMMDLNTLLDSSNENWKLLSAQDINNVGQIVGFGLYDLDGTGPLPSVQRGFLLTPVPEPAITGMLLGALLLGLGCKRR